MRIEPDCFEYLESEGNICRLGEFVSCKNDQGEGLSENNLLARRFG